MIIDNLFIIKLLAALFLGGIVGLERQWRQKFAGLRTNVLVSLGAALFVTLSENIGGDAVGRVISYVVSGIGFLGAGVIMKHGANISGINTAATIWCSAAIGTFCGVGYFTEAAIGTIFIVLTHIIMRPLAVQLSKISTSKGESIHVDYLFTILCKEGKENDLKDLLMKCISENKKLQFKSLTSFKDEYHFEITIKAEIKSIDFQNSTMESITNIISKEKNILKIGWEITGEHND